MLKALSAHILCLALMFSGLPALAQSRSISFDSALTGLGLSYIIDREQSGELDVFSLGANTFGIHSGRTDDIGIYASYTRSYVFSLLEGEDFVARFYAGLGLSTGYVHDYEKGIMVVEDNALCNNMGVYASLACTAGMRVDFLRPLALELSFNVYPGIHLRSDERTGSTKLAFYQNGIYYAFLPTISLIYRL